MKTYFNKILDRLSLKVKAPRAPGAQRLEQAG